MVAYYINLIYNLKYSHSNLNKDYMVLMMYNYYFSYNCNLQLEKIAQNKVHFLRQFRIYQNLILIFGFMVEFYRNYVD